MSPRITSLALVVVLGGTSCAYGASDASSAAACTAGVATFGPGSARGGPGDDVVIGLGGEVHGDEDNDRIFAGREPLRAFGGEGRDFLDGGPMADQLEGGPGQDVLTGELGADRFTYRRVGDTPTDRRGRWSAKEGDSIVDFSGKEGDRIDLSGLQPERWRADQRLKWSDRPHRPHRVWVTRRRGDTFVFVDTSGDRRPDLAIRFIGAVPLSKSDFCGID